MERTASLQAPKLGKIPNARRAPIPLFEANFLPYIGLMLGSLAAAGVAIYNALLVRRFGVALRALLVGVLGWAAAVWLLDQFAVSNVHLLILLARGIGVVAGLVLMREQNHLVRGHLHLEGKTLPLLGSVLFVFVGSIFVVPNEVLAVIFGAVSL